MNIPLGLSPALLLIDIQQGFDDVNYWGGGRNNEDAEANAGKLLAHWRAQGWPVYHIQHCSTLPQSPLHPSHPGNALQTVVQPAKGEPVVKKQTNSAFIGTGLSDTLETANLNQVVICGLTTDHCVSTTVRMAGNLGFDTFLVHDATATFDKVGHNGERYPAQLLHDTAIASLKDEFATVVSTEELIG